MIDVIAETEEVVAQWETKEQKEKNLDVMSPIYVLMLSGWTWKTLWRRVSYFGEFTFYKTVQMCTHYVKVRYIKLKYKAWFAQFGFFLK